MRSFTKDGVNVTDEIRKESKTIDNLVAQVNKTGNPKSKQLLKEARSRLGEWDQIGKNSINWLGRQTAHSNKRYAQRIITLHRQTG